MFLHRYERLTLEVLRYETLDLEPLFFSRAFTSYEYRHIKMTAAPRNSWIRLP
jgi:hypothetical protein